jgi:hypothetical protein
MFTKTVSLTVSMVFIVTHLISQVVVYPAQNANFEYHSDKFKITVYQNGKPYNSYVYQSKIPISGGHEMGGQFGKTFNFTTFSFQGKIDVEVTKLNSRASVAIVRPTRLIPEPINATATREGSTVKFSLSNPAKLSIEFNDDPGLTDGCMVFADSMENASLVPDMTSANVGIVTDSSSLKSTSGKQIVVFKPGMLNIGYWEVPLSVKQIYFSGGSYIVGYVHALRDTLNPLVINGKGILSNNGYPYWYPKSNDNKLRPYIALYIEGGKNNLISDITVCDGSNANIFLKGKNSTINNVKIHGFRLTNDGITPVASNNITVTNCFIHVNDDAVVLYGSNFTMSNCTFWQLGGGSIIQLGWGPNTIRGVNLISFCDVIHAEWIHTNRNAGFVSAMNEVDNPNAKNSIVQNFTFKNIYFDTDIDRLIDIQMEGTRKKQPVAYENFRFENIYFLNKQMNSNPIVYLSDFHDSVSSIKNFVFKNIVINGKTVTPDDPQQKHLLSTKTRAAVSMQ